MKTKVNIRNYFGLFGNAFLFLFVTSSVLSFYFGGGVGNMEGLGTEAFRYFTVDSNILAALAALPMICFHAFAIKGIKFGKRGMFLFKFVGTCAVTLTMLTVLFFLGPTIGYRPMFEGSNFFLHLLCPLLSVLTLIFTEREEAVDRKTSLLGTVPTVVYGIVYIVQVLITEKWPDFYGFNRGGMWYVSVVAMLAATAGIGVLLSFAQTSAKKRK